MTQTTRPDLRRPTVVLVHGAWHGPWCWDDLRPRLERMGWRTTTPQLASASRTGTEPRPGLYDDAQVLARHIDAIDGPVVLIGHSYGGAPVTEFAGRGTGKVTHLVYVAAYQPDAGESLYAMHGAPVPDDVSGVVPVPDNPVTMFYNDVAPDVAAEAVRQLVPQTVRSWSEGVRTAGWRTIPATYVLCEKDQALPPAMQEKFALRAGSLYRLASGHSPFLSMPGELADVLDRALTEAGGQQTTT
jgi:pimeloyl-ACP methyl ester carboxylesterase